MPLDRHLEQHLLILTIDGWGHMQFSITIIVFHIFFPLHGDYRHLSLLKKKMDTSIAYLPCAPSPTSTMSKQDQPTLCNCCTVTDFMPSLWMQQWLDFSKLINDTTRLLLSKGRSECIHPREDLEKMLHRPPCPINKPSTSSNSSETRLRPSGCKSQLTQCHLTLGSRAAHIVSSFPSRRT